jgi:hypothetical protein
MDEFVAMVERIKKIYGEGKDEDTTNRKQKQGKKDTNLDILSTLKRKMQRVDVIICATPLQASQRRATRTLPRLELEHAYLIVIMVHEIGETSLVAIMELSDGSNSE